MSLLINDCKIADSRGLFRHGVRIKTANKAENFQVNRYHSLVREFKKWGYLQIQNEPNHIPIFEI